MATEALVIIKKKRTCARRFFTTAEKSVAEAISDQTEDVASAYKYFEVKAEELFRIDEEIKELLFTSEAEEDFIFSELETAETYRKRFYKISSAVEALQSAAKSRMEVETVSGGTVKNQNDKYRSFKLPSLELKKFDGQPILWTSFWGQFKRIHEDPHIDNFDKFRYLLQSTEPLSKARQFVESFTPSGENYDRVIGELKERFARDDILIDTYIRQLLHLVIYKKHDVPLSDLYDKLSSYLHALESLGVTTDKYAAMLLPMVESAIPLDVLKAWERSRDKNVRPSIDQLLLYIKAEVESEERILIAKEGFDVQASNSAQPTASCIVAKANTSRPNASTKPNTNTSTKAECLFCEKFHPSMECSKLAKLSLADKRELIREKKACFICFKTGHGAKTCRSFPKCLICTRRHYVAMCPLIDEMKLQKSEPETQEKQNSGTLLCLPKVKTTFLQTILVKIVYNGKYFYTRALFDSGAQKSYIRQDIATKLGLSVVSKEFISHTLFGGIETKKDSYNVYQFGIESLDGDFNMDFEAVGQSKICGSLPCVLDRSLLNKLNSLNIKINDCVGDSHEIGLLIGADFSGHLLTGLIVHIEGSLVAINTKLGWTIQGQSITSQSNFSNVNQVSCFFVNTESNFWELELLGINDPSETKSKQKNEFETLKFFRDTVARDSEGRYEVHLPWKEGFPEMLTVNNRDLAYKRLLSTTKKLKGTGMLSKYNKVFEDWLDEGIIERVESVNGLYLYHHAVIKESSLTTPVRPVFDASAKLCGHSLNSSLEKGANLLELIPKLLISFRKNAIGITADIRKAFLQISIASKDRDYLKFLWWEDANTCKKLITFRHKRVVFGVTCSPFLLAATINHHLDSVVDERFTIAQQLKSSFYVDNCVHSVNSDLERKEFIETSKALMNEAKFDLRGWVYGPSESENTQSVLGIMWNNMTDELSINFEYNEISCAITKRVLLSCAQSVFDPIGVTCPTTIIPKMLLQRCWTLKLDWDDKLPDDIAKEFLVWYRQLKSLNKITIPRRLTDVSVNNCNLSIHTFCDASKYAYAACVFLRSEQKGKVQVRLIIAKARVAPVKVITIPRLELVAAVISVRLYRQAKEALDLHDVKSYFWSDSSVVLSWIQRDNNWTVFVNNRVKEIRNFTAKTQWFHVAGDNNPADLPSRGCSPDKLRESCWWTGPQWLYREPVDWPKSDVVLNDEIALSEVSKVLLSTQTDPFSSRLLYFSKYSKLVRCVGWMFRFVYNCKSGKNNISRLSSDLSYSEYVSAERALLKLIQFESYGVTTSLSRVSGLETVLLEDGLFHVKSRLLLGDAPENFKFPILVPGKHPIVHKLIFQTHCQLRHAGATIVISKLREFYWLTQARRNVSNIISKCIICKRFTCKAAQAPTAPLPENRIKTGKVFEVVGVDLAGPLFLKSREKCWVVLFTCAVFRAVHLELTLSLSTESFLMAFRRFIARRGRVRVVYSDNGTNFVGANNLFKSLDWDHIKNQLCLEKIEWKFNVPSAPWWGGFWERLVRSLKDLLRRVLGSASLSYVELETVLIDCEAVLNSRPLTYISDIDTLSPITPMHFLQDLSSNSVQDIDMIDLKSLNVRVKYIQNLRDNLKERFRKEYLGSLVQHYSFLRNKSLVQEGDVVLVETEGKRQLWPIGIVTKVIKGVDNMIRAATVKLNGSTLTRPVQKLYPLELNDSRPYVTRAGRIVRLPERLVCK